MNLPASQLAGRFLRFFQPLNTSPIRAEDLCVKLHARAAIGSGASRTRLPGAFPSGLPQLCRILLAVTSGWPATMASNVISRTAFSLFGFGPFGRPPLIGRRRPVHTLRMVSGQRLRPSPPLLGAMPGGWRLSLHRMIVGHGDKPPERRLDGVPASVRFG